MDAETVEILADKLGIATAELMTYYIKLAPYPGYVAGISLTGLIISLMWCFPYAKKCIEQDVASFFEVAVAMTSGIVAIGCFGIFTQASFAFVRATLSPESYAIERILRAINGCP